MEVSDVSCQDLLTTEETSKFSSQELLTTMETDKVGSQELPTTMETGNVGSQDLTTTIDNIEVKVNSQDSVESMDHFDTGGDEFFVCQDLIDFDLPDSAPWRERLSEEEKKGLATFGDMLKDIVRFQAMWKSSKALLDKNIINKAQKQMLERFIHHINVEEGIGTQDFKATQEIMSMVESSGEGNTPNLLSSDSENTRHLMMVENQENVPVPSRILCTNTNKKMSMVEKQNEGNAHHNINDTQPLPKKDMAIVEKRNEEYNPPNILCTQSANVKNVTVVDKHIREDILPNILHPQSSHKSMTEVKVNEENVPPNTLHALLDPKRKAIVAETENEINMSPKTPRLQSLLPGTPKRHLSKNQRETRNLLLAWLKLAKMAAKERELNPSNSGLLELKNYIVEIHKTLMTGVIDESTMTPPGVFSTRERVATYKGVLHKYPTKGSPEEWEKEVWTVLDRYNGLVEKAKKDIKDNGGDKAMESLFKCAAWLLFTLVSLHPFSDGNGRLCRLLASYSLAIVTPFPSPIYNIFSPSTKHDFIDAVVDARQSSSQHPAQLAGLMVESNWYAWKQFLCLVGPALTITRSQDELL